VDAKLRSDRGCER
jgi:hypothetical protein